MQDREKKLAIGLGVVLVVAFALPAFKGWFLQPVTDANNALTAARERLEDVREDEHKLNIAKSNLLDWKYESLPPQPYTAQREYQEWLMDVARMSGFVDPEPTLGSFSARGKTFIEIPVTIEARATLEQAARFLYHAERVALLHRIQTLELKSPASVGNPLLEVTILARGLSLTDASDRTQLFPTTTLEDDATAESKTLTVSPLKGFPSVDGFQVKIDEELLTVRKLDATTLSVERGSEETQAVAHAAGSLVELFPVDREAFLSGRSFDEYVDLLKNSPFTKPSPPMEYNLDLSPTSPQTVTRGEPWTLKLSLSGWNPGGGPAKYEVKGDVPQGLKIDPRSGELSWNAEEGVEARKYDVTLVARSEILSGQQVQATLPITLREPNLPPTVEFPETPKAYSGRPLTLAVSADDPDGPNESLKFSLSGDVPTGATIDPATGKLTWVPPLTLELGDYKLNVAVADSGDPQQTTTKPLSIKLEDDAALFTKLVGVFNNAGQQEAMLNNLASGETRRVREGATIDAADLSGTISRIRADHVEVTLGDQTYRLDIGKNLRQLTPIATSAEDKPADDAAASSS